MSVEVIKPGLLTTLQDRGRHGCAMLGVGTAGAMDDVALRLSNALVGNAPDAAALEITLIGPRLRFLSATTMALAGAEFPARIGDEKIPMWQPVAVDRGAVLDVGTARHGARACLAIGGGFAVEPTLGSASTDVNARLGGRALHADDRLTALAPAVARGRAPRWSLDPRPWFDPDAARPLRLIRGTHFDALDDASRRALFEGEFRVGSESNRVGFRLEGPVLRLGAPIEMVSEPLATGTLQLPPGGQPIALMVERPTVGGYPRIGQIAAIDLPRLAQRRPGESVRFEEIDLAAAQTRYLERESALDRLIGAIGERLTA